MELCSHTYLELLRSVHNAHVIGFGNKKKKIKEFEACIEKWRPQSILDFGCGKGALLQTLEEKYPHINFIGYDPAVLDYNTLPTQKFDVVFCNDVLEHVEPLYIDKVLNFIQTHSNKYVWLRIDTQPATKVLLDGRNAHLIIEDEEWWRERLGFAMDMKILNMYKNKKQRIDVELIHE